jgi:phosphohistidine phosphatase
MEIILWRHAEAEDREPDLARALTAKGRHQAQQMAQWLKPQFSGPVRVLASPAVRTRETAEALGLPYEISGRIAPDCSADAMLAASGWPGGHGLVILVGHNPAISVLASRLAGNTASSIALGRAAAWWFAGAADDAGGPPRLALKIAMTPSRLPAM